MFIRLVEVVARNQRNGHTFSLLSCEKNIFLPEGLFVCFTDFILVIAGNLLKNSFYSLFLIPTNLYPIVNVLFKTEIM